MHDPTISSAQSESFSHLAEDPNQRLKLVIWAYFFLIIFEGALRKWFLPGLATPLLVIRDPIALWLVFMAWKQNLLPGNIYQSGMVLIAILGIYTATFAGHGSLMVAIFGARILLLHFPLMFVIGSIFDLGDVLKIGKVVILMTVPMTLLIAIQFYSPQEAWVNRGIGGDMAGAGFDGALGYFRPPGTFSFTTGTTLFFSLASSYIIYYWLNLQSINRLLLLSATLALLFAVPLSLSRGLLFQIGVSFIFALIIISKKPKLLGHLIVIGLVGLLLLFVLSQISLFQTASDVFTSRFDAASDYEGGVKGTILDRFLGGLFESITESNDLPFLGYGLGMGTNVGSTLLTGNRTFLIAEGEWGRLIGELGIIMGILVILIRIGLVTKMLLLGYQYMVKGDFMPWLLLSFGSLLIVQGQWGQPTVLGFSTLIGGLIIASFRKQ
ncbi:hypothetical protein [Pleomorphovibrio marinus]|uniref:hypothetical protein n=1 Tax=Pleomorphovibrio marinus TaxID=2164132 RepID=UPI000E0AC631|nr:hypothetical protein [Pleomorphovibrio marinus]